MNYRGGCFFRFQAARQAARQTVRQLTSALGASFSAWALQWSLMSLFGGLLWWLSSANLFSGSSSEALFDGFLRWLSSMNLFGDSLPWIFSVALFGGSLRWLSLVAFKVPGGPLIGMICRQYETSVSNCSQCVWQDDLNRNNSIGLRVLRSHERLFKQRESISSSRVAALSVVQTIGIRSTWSRGS